MPFADNPQRMSLLLFTDMRQLAMPCVQSNIIEQWLLVNNTPDLDTVFTQTRSLDNAQKALNPSVYTGHLSFLQLL